MRIQHNIMAMNAYRNYNTNTSALSKNLEKLSSGYKINRAGDDAAGLAISEKMRAQITGLEKAQDNAKDGISLVQTAEGALTEVHDMLNRMYSLAEQSANGTYEDETDRAQLQKEVEQLKSEINRIADASNFNGIKLLDGTMGLNTDAFKLEYMGATEAGVMTGVKGAMPGAGTDPASNTVLHTNGVTGQAGSFSIDLSGVQGISTSAAGTASVTIKIGTATFTITAASTGTDLTAANIATGMADFALVVDSSGSLSVVKAASLAGSTGAAGSLVYTISGTADKLTFNTAGYFDKAGDYQTGAGAIDDDVNDGALVNPESWTVSVTAGADTDMGVNGPNIAVTNITQAKKDEIGKLGQTSFTVDVTKFTDGMKISIAGQDVNIALEKATADANPGYLDLSDLDLSQTADQEEALRRISVAFAGNGNVSVGYKGGNTLTLSEKADPSTGMSVAGKDYQKAMETVAGFESLVSFTSAETKAATKIDATAGAIRAGDILTINDKQYVFTDDPNNANGTQNEDGAIYVQMGVGGASAMENLETLLSNDGLDVKRADDELIVYAKSADDNSPAILGKGLTLQIGDTSDSYNQLTVAMKDIHTAALGIKDLNVGNQDDASDALSVIKDAINYVSDVRGTLGATQNRLDHTINNLSVMTENIQDAESTIRDTDVAEEMMAYTKNNILIQSAQAMLAQANQVPQGVLQLLQ